MSKAAPKLSAVPEVQGRSNVVATDVGRDDLLAGSIVSKRDKRRAAIVSLCLRHSLHIEKWPVNDLICGVFPRS